MQQIAQSAFILFFIVSNALQSQAVFDLGFAQSSNLRNAIQHLEKAKKNFEYRKLLAGKSNQSNVKKRLGDLGFDLRPAELKPLATDLHGYFMIPVYSIVSIGLGAKYFFESMLFSKGIKGSLDQSNFRPEWVVGMELPWFSIQAECEYLTGKKQDAGGIWSNRSILTLSAKKDFLINRSGSLRAYALAGYTVQKNAGKEFYSRPFQVKLGLEWRFQTRFRKD